MLRECLASVCDELERTVVAVRRQMWTGHTQPELDRRPDRPPACVDNAPAELDLVRETRDTLAAGS